MALLLEQLLPCSRLVSICFMPGFIAFYAGFLHVYADFRHIILAF